MICRSRGIRLIQKHLHGQALAFGHPPLVIYRTFSIHAFGTPEVHRSSVLLGLTVVYSPLSSCTYKFVISDGEVTEYGKNRITLATRARVRAGQAGGPERRAPGDLRGLRGAAQGVAGGEGGGGATRSAARGRSGLARRRRGREPCLEHPQPLVGFCGFSLVVGWAPAFSVLVLPVPCSVLCQCWPMDCRRYIPGTSKMPVIVMSRSGSLGTTTRALQRFESPEKRSKSVRNFVDGPSQKRVPVRHQVSH